MEEYAILASGIQKRFRSFRDKGTSLKEKILFKSRRSYEYHDVLRGVDLAVRPGEAVGIIGENGCGKSTMLKLLSGIMRPDSGSIEMRGRVSALIELGAGFHPDMSGRENIYTNAAIFGLSKKEIDRRLDTIIGFSGLEGAIDDPVRTYSSGMYMRLAFSVAINVDADILLVDEILAVGDAAFQAKCFNRLREIKKTGTTIVIVSHALSQIEQFCDRSVWIRDGIIAAEGKPSEVHPAYLEYMGKKLSGVAPEPGASEPSADKPHRGSGDATITSVRLTDETGAECGSFATGSTILLRFDYTARAQLDDSVFGFLIFRNDGLPCYGTSTQIDHLSGLRLQEGGTVTCRLNRVDLLPGEYYFDLDIHREDGLVYDTFHCAKQFTIYSGASEVGLVRFDHKWDIR